MTKDHIAIVGLGYVGLPIAVEFAKKHIVIGFDVDESKIASLKQNEDPTKSVTPQELQEVTIDFTLDPSHLKKANFIIICVPTPITKEKKPDLVFLEKASALVGSNLSKDTIVVYESTVYPGVTEDVCKPILEEKSGLVCGVDFKIGYSPERINPGDEKHTFSSIVKVVAGMDEESTEKIAKIYESVVDAGVFKAESIKVAEAAKVIENTQRDLNIALMNELSLIFEKIGISTSAVLKAASTKWNFHNYYPGLVGGHCIGVDPYYLTYKAQELGYTPKVILAGRETNDNMYKQIIRFAREGLKKIGKELQSASIFLMGLTFKENVNDTRNSKVIELVEDLKKETKNIMCVDPTLKKEEIEKYGVQAVAKEEGDQIDVVIYAVDHKEFKSITLEDLKAKTKQKAILIDVKNRFIKAEAERLGFIYKSF